MRILSKLACLRKPLTTLLIAVALHTLMISVALHRPSANCLVAVKSAHAAECSDGTCGKHKQ